MGLYEANSTYVLAGGGLLLLFCVYRCFCVKKGPKRPGMGGGKVPPRPVGACGAGAASAAAGKKAAPPAGGKAAPQAGAKAAAPPPPNNPAYGGTMRQPAKGVAPPPNNAAYGGTMKQPAKPPGPGGALPTRPGAGGKAPPPPAPRPRK